jgi:S-DNA-T family DNA segregation ATPase FtsK/SpoIIIE
VRLAALSGPQIGRVIDVRGTFRIGRDPENRLVLDDPKVSRRHATVTARAAGAVVVDDHESLNGTWVNGERISGACALRAGDRLRIGVSEFLVTYLTDEDGDGRATQFARPGVRLVHDAGPVAGQ